MALTTVTPGGTWTRRVSPENGVRSERHPIPVHLVLADFSWGWDSFVAIGTLALAIGTWLAWSTRTMAAASRDDERAQWRPVLVPDQNGAVDYDDETGEMSFWVRNVGRGPAFGINAQLRSGNRPLGASVPTGPGTAVTLAP